MSADPVRTWTAVLDRFEADIAVAISGGPYQPWAPPSDLGPIPDALVSKARRILDAQRESLALIALNRADAASHLRALNAGTPAAYPLFLDTRA